MGDILEDLTGCKFGRLTVIERAEDYVEPKSKKRHPQWLCLCTCGNRKIILGNNLKRGLTNSCGCIKKEVASIIHKKKNNYENIGNGITKVFFNNNNGYFLCDTSEWDKVKDITWIKSGNGYAYGVIKNQYVKFHRYIMDVNDKEHEVDHIDGNPLNNLKTNLRICYKEENSMNQKISTKNTSGHVGIYWDASRNKWCARINANKKTIFLGRFDDYDMAVREREKAEEIYHGKYATKKSRDGTYKKISLHETLQKRINR